MREVSPIRAARRAAFAVLAAAFAVSGTRVPAAAGDEPIPKGTPFPSDKTCTLRIDDSPYVVTGPTVIPPSAEITVQLGVSILGCRGASLDVQGGLKVHGTVDCWVKIQDIDFSPTTNPRRGLHLDMADLGGCKFVHGQDRALKGAVTIENSCWQSTCAFDVRIESGFLKIMTVEFAMPCKIRCGKSEGGARVPEIDVRSSWMRELAISGPAAVTIRNSELKAGLVCRRVTQVMLDGCDLTGDVAFHQDATDSFKQVTITKCNFFSGSLVLERPTAPQATLDRMRIDKIYFGPKTGPGETTDAAVKARIQDGEDDPKSTVRAIWNRTMERPHDLVSYTLRGRAPPLRWN